MALNHGMEFMPRMNEFELEIIGDANVNAVNKDGFGPESVEEAAMVHDLGRPEVVAPPADDSECMDDRNKGRKLQLAGNRALSEVVADYLNPEQPAKPLSHALLSKARELMAMGRTPHFHEACAAIGVVADGAVIRFIGENMEAIKPIALKWLEPLIDVRTCSDEDFVSMAAVAQERGRQTELFDAGPEELIEMLAAADLPIERFSTGHNTVGHRIDVSENTYDNQAFMDAHRDADGQPLGALAVSLGLYKMQLEDDGFSYEDVRQELLRVSVYNIAVLQMAETPGTPGVIVG